MSNSRYPALTWPWVGVILCLALLGQEYMLQAAGPNAPLTLYRIVLMSVGVTSVTLVLLPPPRPHRPERPAQPSPPSPRR